MIPVPFAESNLILDTVPGALAPLEPQPLQVARLQLRDVGVNAYLSCWKLTREEMEEMQKTGRVWLLVIGNLHPCVSVAGVKPVEILPGEESEDDCEGK